MSLSVVAAGMITSLGLNAPSTCAAIRAGISGLRVDNLWDPYGGKYMSVGRPPTSQWWEGPDMLAHLAAPVILECLQAVPELSPARVPVYVLLAPPTRAFREPDLESVIAKELQKRLAYTLPPTSRIIGQGRAAIVPGLLEASRTITEEKATHCIIVGVDTFLRQRVAQAFMDKRRVLVEGNSNGFVPGEAACAVMLTAAGRQRGSELRIAGWGSGHEKGAVDSDEPLTGDGLTGALRVALDRAGIRMADTHYWLNDQNGEHYKFKEATIAQIRLERRERPAEQRYEIWHPIEHLGEIGTAIGPCLLGAALAAHNGGYAPGPRAMFHVGDDDGERAALVLEWVERN